MKNSLKLLDEVLNKKNYTKEDIIYLMSLKKPEYLEKLYKKAYEVKEKYIGKVFQSRASGDFKVVGSS